MNVDDEETRLKEKVAHMHTLPDHLSLHPSLLNFALGVLYDISQGVGVGLNTAYVCA